VKFFVLNLPLTPLILTMDIKLVKILPCFYQVWYIGLNFIAETAFQYALYGMSKAAVPVQILSTLWFLFLLTFSDAIQNSIRVIFTQLAWMLFTMWYMVRLYLIFSEEPPENPIVLYEKDDRIVFFCLFLAFYCQYQHRGSLRFVYLLVFTSKLPRILRLIAISNLLGRTHDNPINRADR